MSRSILITGVAGFIGSNLADMLLREGYRVVGLDDLSQGVIEQVPEGTEFHQADIRSPQIQPLFGGVDTVFHLAAKNCISDCQADPVATAAINVWGSVQVFEAARLEKVRKVVYAESSALYEGTKVLPTPEEEESPQSFYAVSKQAERLFAEAYTRYYGLLSTALRYFCVYGPRQDYRRTIPPVMSAFIIKILNGQSPIIYGDGSKRRDFVYVDDINDFHLRCIHDARSDGQVFNLGSGVSHSVSEILALVQKMLERPIAAEYRSELSGEALETRADITRAQGLGWTPKTSLSEGLGHMVEYISKELKMR